MCGEKGMPQVSKPDHIHPLLEVSKHLAHNSQKCVLSEFAGFLSFYVSYLESASFRLSFVI